ncbi:MAG: alkaline phosphatase D family protein [Aliarcobacter sp.]|jgi:alkaline phosphatase D|nr:alkaline phosphatase D family protein [Aliarcobacter sp.]
MIKFTRRDFLKVSALSFCTLVVSTGITACSSSSNSTNVSFLHGVASGDPLTNSVIIWTRLTPSDSIDELNLNYEVSKSDTFATLSHSGSLTTKKTEDYTVKIDLQNLEENTVYYYRFKSNNKISIVGKTKTLSSSPSQVKFAVFSCSNYPNGYFNSYNEVSKIEDIDVVLHLGDYIYEYGMYEKDGITPAYATNNAVSINRVLEKDNDTELLTLDDYRKRYAIYHTDEGSISIHKNLPFITIWDDHEVANDIYKDGAQNHDSTEGDFETRKLAALQAYFEWLPIRPVVQDNDEIIYRSFDFGNLVSLHMLDTRIIGRDIQLDYSNYFDDLGNFDQSTFISDMSDSSRSMIGNEQLSWLQGKLASSSAKWQVLGQQVLMGKMFLPAELLTLIVQLNADLTSEQKIAVLTQLNTVLVELVTIKTRILQGDTTVSTEESVRLTTVLPYNLDAWDGYSYEREVLYATIRNLGKNVVVLAGDTHNSWANELKDNNGNNIAVEFATTSVTSPGMEEYAGLSTKEIAMQFEGAITLLIDDLKYTNLNQRGYLIVEFNENEAIATWNYIDNVNSTSYSLDETRKKQLKTVLGNKTIQSV